LISWRPRRDLNPAETEKNLEFFLANVAESGHTWRSLNVGVQMRTGSAKRLWKLLYSRRLSISRGEGTSMLFSAS
jgi:hypothetical protein